MARPGLTTHRKFRRLARTLQSAILARGSLELLWESCYESGDDYVGTAEDIETLVAWTGEPGFLAQAMRDAGAPEGAGFIEVVEPTDPGALERYRVHDLWHHAPDYVRKRRERELQRQEKLAPSKKRRRSAPRGGQCPPSSDCLPEVDRTPSPSPSPSPSPEEEQSDSSAPHAATEPPVLTFPTRGKLKTWDLTPSQLAEWQADYPGVDVLAECRKGLAWAKANGPKTAKGMPAYLVGWLNRATNRGGITTPPPSARVDQVRRTVVNRETGGVSPWVAECIALHAGECFTEAEHREKCATRKAVSA